MGKPIYLNALRVLQGRAKRTPVSSKSASLDLRLGVKETAASNQMNIRVSDEFKKLVGDGARELGVSMAQLVEVAVTEYLSARRK